MKDIQSPHADLPDYQPRKNPEFALPEGLRRERKPPYDRDKGYDEGRVEKTGPRAG
jgi:hypothetical protein